MEITDPDKTIALKITKFPNNLLIPGVDNLIHFQAVNRFNKKAFFRFNFEGENLKVGIPAELKEGNIIEFGPGEAKNFQIALAPSGDGAGKLIMFVNWMKVVEYTVKVKKVRDNVPKSLIGKIFKQVDTLHISKFTDTFNMNEYIESLTLKEVEKIEKEYTSKKQEYKALSLQKQNIITGKGPVKIKGLKIDDGMGIEEIDAKKKLILTDIQESLRKLAKGYVHNNNMQKALKYALKLMDEREKLKFHYGLIRAYGSIDLDNTINLIKDITVREKKNALIRSVAFDQIKRDPEQAPKLAYLIKDPNMRQNLIFDIIGNSIAINPTAATKISTLITDDLLKINVLFNIAKELYENEKKSDLINLFNNIISILEKSSQYNLSENNFNNQAYVFYRNAMTAIAELESPHTVDTILVGFELRDVKDKVSEDIFDVIYEMVDEIRTKMEPSPVYSQYYSFNTLTSNINDFIKNFSTYGGNISRNVLKNEFNFNLIFLSLFSYDFSIFPIIDKIYSDLTQNSKKSFAYYIFPSKENHSQSELMTINNTLTHFFATNLKEKSGPVLIFNLDFIPYVGKPTIILSSDTEIPNNFKTELMKSLGDSANLIIDKSLFKGGTTLENLKQLFNPNMFNIFNLVLSYDLINEYDVFKSFILSFL
jgi:hypothetical protein